MKASVCALLLFCLLLSTMATTISDPNPIRVFLKQASDRIGQKGHLEKEGFLRQNVFHKSAVIRLDDAHLNLRVSEFYDRFVANSIDFSGDNWQIEMDPTSRMAWFSREVEDFRKPFVATGGVLMRKDADWQFLQLNVTKGIEAPQPKQKDMIDISVMSFNLRYGTANDGLNSWYNRDHLVFRVLNNYRPSLFGVQEALLFQLEEIEANVPGYKWLGVGRDDGISNGEFSAIFYKVEEFTVLNEGTFWYCNRPDQPGCTSYGNNLPRICTWAQFYHTYSGRTLFHYNTHFDHESVNSRERSSEQLINHIRSQQSTGPFVITGDFNNALESSYEITYLKNNGFDDSFRVLYPNATNVGTFNGFTGATSGTKIDYVFTPRDPAVGGQASIKSAEIIHYSDPDTGRYPSDHFPVVAHFVLS